MQEIAPGVFVETGFRCVNVGAILTDDGFVLIDTPPYPAEARYWRQTLTSIADKPILAVINTDSHHERVIGNTWFREGVGVAHDETITYLRNLPNAFVDTTVNALTEDPIERMSFTGAKLRIPSVGFSHRMQLRYGGRTIPLLAMAGPMTGSIWVHLPDERVLFAGDSVTTGQHLHLSSPTTKAWLESLTILRRSRFAADIIIAGRGALADKAATEPISNYLRLARRRVQSLYRAGRPRADTSTLVPELLELFPTSPHDLEAAQRRVKIGLERIYEEIKSVEQLDDLDEEGNTAQED